MYKMNFFNDVYIAMVTSESRGSGLDSQIEFLTSKVLERKEKSATILDQCCGHGRHLDKLYKRGYTNLHGVDNNKSFIDFAKEMIDDTVYLTCSDIFSYQINCQFDFIINMESSIVSFSKVDLEKMFHLNQELLKSDDVFVVHTFNPLFLVNSLPKRTWFKIDSCGYVMEDRIVDLADSRLDISQIRILGDDKRKYETFISRICLTLHFKRELLEYASKSGFIIQGLYGGFDGSDYDEQASPNIICVFSQRSPDVACEVRDAGHESRHCAKA